jgi:hypothetical protein
MLPLPGMLIALPNTSEPERSTMTRLTTFLIACGIAAFSYGAIAQTYPARAVRVVVAYPAGGSIDTVARLTSQRFAQALGQQFPVENRSGAASLAPKTWCVPGRTATRC